GDDGRGAIHFPLDGGKLAADLLLPALLRRLVEKAEVVDGEHDRDAIVERQILRGLVGDVPERDVGLGQERPGQGAKQPGQAFLLPEGRGVGLKPALGKMPLRARPQEEHRVEPTVRDPEQFLG
ncbi:MAG: hypothetical protein ACK559_07560, partial [bacterium]